MKKDQLGTHTGSTHQTVTESTNRLDPRRRNMGNLEHLEISKGRPTGVGMVREDCGHL